MMCFHQPAPNDGEDGRLLLLLLSALHFINLKSLFVVVVVIVIVVAAVVVVPRGDYTPEGSGQLVNCWKFWCPMKNKMTLGELQRRASVWEKSETASVQYRISVSGHKTSRTRTLASLLNHQLVFTWLGTWLLLLHDHLGGSFLIGGQADFFNATSSWWAPQSHLAHEL